MFKKTKIKIGAAIASTIMVAGAIGTAAGMINNNQSSHKILKSSKTIENANNNQQANNFIVNQTKNQSENSFQALNNTVLPKNFFSQNQLSQISNIISKQTYHIQGNAFATGNPEQIKKVNEFMHSVQKNVINHIQQQGLQKNGLTNILVNKYRVSKSWLETEANNENFKSNVKFYKVELQQKINKLKGEFEKINIKNVNACGFNNDYIVQGLNLTKNEESYILQFSINHNLKSQAKNLLKSINDKYQWMLKYESWDWDANIIYSNFQSLVTQMQNLYETQFNSPTNSEKQILENKITALKLQIKERTNADKDALTGLAAILANQFGLLEPDKVLMSLKHNLAWDERSYIVNYSNVDNQAKNQIINLWNEMNKFYHYALNDISMGIMHFHFSSYTQFKELIKQIENRYQAITTPERTGLVVMKHAESVVNKYAEEMKGIAIASSVATGIGIALAAAYWASAFFDFGATIPDAVAATTSAAATTVAMGCMWATYSETNELAKKIEGGIVNWTYYLATAYGAQGLFFKNTWQSFKNLFTSRMTYIVNYTDGVITTEVGIIDACAWADPLLTVIGTINELFAISITVAKIAINGVNNSWLNLVY